MITDAVPLQLQTLYQSLVDAHLLADRDSALPGRPFRRTIRGRAYWYMSFREGDKVRSRYIGPDTDDQRAAVEGLRQRYDSKVAFERRCAAMVVQLRAARVPALDAPSGALLGTLADSGVFDLGGTLVGTHAFRLYDLDLGRYVTQSAPSLTEDIDIASYQQLSVALVRDHGARADPPLAKRLEALGLTPAATLDPKGRTGRWRDATGQASLDFLAPGLGPDLEPVLLDALGVYAEQLRFLNYLIANPVPAVALYRSGILVRVPQPARYAIHKLIVSQERAAHAAAKARKDVAQARAIILAMVQDRPYELGEAYREALDGGPRWQELIGRALALAPDLREVLDGL
jgi:hypothetical protein